MLKKLNPDDSLLVIIDVQEKLVNALTLDTITKKVSILAETANILNIPTIITEQYPKGLGNTVEAVKSKVNPKIEILEKTTFSALNAIKKPLDKYNKKQIILCGIEMHICVLQTALHLIEQGYEVFIVKDACASRDLEEILVATERLKQNNATIMTLEMAVFELLGSSNHPNFKEIQALIK